MDNPASPDDLRTLGGFVSAHNDFRYDGRPERYTFWLISFSSMVDGRVDGRMISFEAEGRDDAEALNKIRAQVREFYRQK